MLDTSPENLWKEVQAAERVRDARLSIFQEQLEAYTSPFYREAAASADVENPDYDPENHLYEYVAQVVPDLVFQNPRVRVRSRRTGLMSGEVEQSYHHGLNRWVRDVDLAQTLDALAHDFLFNFAVAMVTPERNPTVYMDEAWDKEPEWPQVVRISQYRYFRDPLALTERECRYQGHAWVVDKDDLAKRAKDADEDEGWSVEAIEDLAVGSGTERLRTAQGKYQSADDPERESVVVYEVWVPEFEDEDHPGSEEGFHGTIFTLAVGADESGNTSLGQIRDPRPYYGPKTGPYITAGGYYVPDDCYRLSPTVAVEGQRRDLNRHARGISGSAARYKRLVLCGDAAVEQKLRESEHDLVVVVPGLDKESVIQLELGGITEQMLSYLGLAKERLDRNSGMSEAARGNVTGQGTATEVAIADAASSRRIDYLKSQFHRFVRSVLRNVAWFMWDSETMVWPLAAEDAKEMGLAPDLPIYFEGGDRRKIEGAGFDDLEVEIEPMSMERVSEGVAQRRAVALFDLLVQVATVAPAAPFVRWPHLLELLGDAFNVPELGSLVDEQMLAQVAQAALQGAPSDARFGSYSGGGQQGGAQRPQGGAGGSRRANPTPGPSRLAGQSTGSQAGQTAKAG